MYLRSAFVVYLSIYLFINLPRYHILCGEDSTQQGRKNAIITPKPSFTNTVDSECDCRPNPCNQLTPYHYMISHHLVVLFLMPGVLLTTVPACTREHPCCVYFTYIHSKHTAFFATILRPHFYDSIAIPYNYWARIAKLRHQCRMETAGFNLQS